MTELLVTFLGPHRLWVLARIDIDDELGASGVKSLIDCIDQALARASPYIARVDVVPATRTGTAACTSTPR